MELSESIELACGAEVAFSLLDDLCDYPRWLGIVAAAEPAEPADSAELADSAEQRRESASVGPGDPAWFVELRARVGPLTRSKRLRMVRTHHDAPRRVRFERRELDGREHSPWVLDVEVAPGAERTVATMHLSYGGGFGSSVLERMVRDEVGQARGRLAGLAEVAQGHRTAEP